MLNKKNKKCCNNDSIICELISEFDLNVVNTTSSDHSRPITHAAIHRLGLELAGQKDFGSHNNIIGWGTKEQKYFTKIGADKTKVLLEKAITKNVPLVILSKGIFGEVLDAIIKIGDATKTPIIRTDMHLSLISSTIGTSVATYLAEIKEKHGSLVIVNGYGVMITGASGVGKSEAVIELVQNGHSFVSDDTVRIKRIGQTFIGYPSDITKDILEVRGVGLINVKTIYGTQSVREHSNIDLIIELIDARKNNGGFDRLGTAEMKEEILGGFIPKIILPVKEGRSTSSLVEVAVNAHIARHMGDDPIETIAKRRAVK